MDFLPPAFTTCWNSRQLLPPMLNLGWGVIEPLAKAGQLRAVVATLGLSAGINFSLRSVLITAASYRHDHLEREIAPHHLRASTVPVPARLAHLRKILLRGSCSFDEAVAGADRMTVAVTLFALLELYKQGEATWQQAAPFAPITIAAVEQAQRPYLIQGAA